MGEARLEGLFPQLPHSQVPCQALLPEDSLSPEGQMTHMERVDTREITGKGPRSLEEDLSVLSERCRKQTGQDGTSFLGRWPTKGFVATVQGSWP